MHIISTVSVVGTEMLSVLLAQLCFVATLNTVGYAFCVLIFGPRECACAIFFLAFCMPAVVCLVVWLKIEKLKRSKYELTVDLTEA